jgi:CDP-diacylglycerol--serine O-phosphatidyltransferase
MKKFRNNIPNFITLLNLLSGGVAIFLVFTSDLVMASVFIFFAAVFDFLDGLAARLLDAKSEIGAELDSLADIISFGLAPSAIIYRLLMLSPDLPAITAGELNVFPFLGLLLAAAGAWRLARFNTDPGQETEFKGLPIPAAGLFVAALPLIIGQSEQFPQIADITGSFYSLSFTVVLLSWLMVSGIPMMSLKMKSLRWEENKFRYILLAASLLLLIFFKFIAVPLIIFLYIILSFISLPGKKKKAQI